MSIKDKLRHFIEDKLVVFPDEAEFTDADNIFEMGYVNSLFAMKLVNHIEEEFHLEIDNEELDMKNFYSIDRMTAFILEKQIK